MRTPEEPETVQKDMDGRSRAIAGQMARLRGEHALTQTLIERSQQQLSASRKLLVSGGRGYSAATAIAATLRAEAITKAKQHVRDARVARSASEARAGTGPCEWADSRGAAQLLDTFESALALYRAELESLA